MKTLELTESVHGLKLTSLLKSGLPSIFLRERKKGSWMAVFSQAQILPNLLSLFQIQQDVVDLYGLL